LRRLSNLLSWKLKLLQLKKSPKLKLLNHQPLMPVNPISMKRLLKQKKHRRKVSFPGCLAKRILRIKSLIKVVSSMPLLRKLQLLKIDMRLPPGLKLRFLKKSPQQTWPHLNLRLWKLKLL